MNISGLQKLSLIDYPGVIASVVFTQGCVFRCPYCHNPDLIKIEKGKLSEKEVLEFLRSRRGFIEGICVTGGEPTLQRDLPEFMQELKSFGFQTKLDTAGAVPEMVKKLIEKNLVDYIAMDIKASWKNYPKAVNVKNENACANPKKTFELIQKSGVKHEFRTTIFPQVHTMDDFLEIGSYLKPGERYYIQNIRYTKTLDPNLDTSKRLEGEEIARMLRVEYPKLKIEVR